MRSCTCESMRCSTTFGTRYGFPLWRWRTTSTTCTCPSSLQWSCATLKLNESPSTLVKQPLGVLPYPKTPSTHFKLLETKGIEYPALLDLNAHIRVRCTGTGQ